jgi:hypothetical protein
MTEVDGRADDRLAADIQAINPEALRATLISNVGNHCEVWRTSRRAPRVDNPTHHADETSPYTEFVIKHPIIDYNDREIRLLATHYRLLKAQLDDIIPDALFLITRINGRRNVCVLARAVNIWFNIANPQNRDEAIPLLRESPKAKLQLECFLETARELRDADNPKLIDLYGLDNLVLDTNREIRYLDSFDVFFYEDMLDLFGEPDPELASKIKISRGRLAYLEDILAEAKQGW